MTVSGLEFNVEGLGSVTLLSYHKLNDGRLQLGKA